MTATNHVLTGSVFAFATAAVLPWWAILPAAFLLHFVLDALPHFGQRDNDYAAISRLKWFLPIDATLGAATLLSIVILRPEYWLLALLGGVMCASSDLWSARRFLRFLRTDDASRSTDWFSRFHGSLQWGERLWGAWIELAWALAFGLILWTYL